ncbi:MAG: MoxR family ATPase [Solirubrobacterales bacterium]|nr:MoxR family ATPase [Solirubrobacterales bacterium]
MPAPPLTPTRGTGPRYRWPAKSVSSLLPHICRPKPGPVDTLTLRARRPEGGRPAQPDVHVTASRSGWAAQLQAQRATGARLKWKKPVQEFTTIQELEDALLRASYLPDRGLATALFLALRVRKPLLLEGEAGVGKTEAAKAVASSLGARLIRLQCYEGLDVAHAVYEWNYTRQLLHIRATQETGAVAEDELFGEKFLIRRPLLEAITSPEPVVLLIDEIDRADDEFEAFLLEMLSDFQITIPEIGTISAERRPVVVLTSNRTRELHDALKRRCLFHWIGHPSCEREIEIVRLRVPGVPGRLAAEAVKFVQALRGLDLAKPPGVAETVDWAQALAALGQDELDADIVESTIGSVLKYHEDIELVRDEALVSLLAEARAAR